MKKSPLRWLTSSLVAVAALSACGGGNEVEKPATFELLPDDLVGAPCAQCRSGHLVGMAADAAPLSNAEVLVVDAGGNMQRSRTGADGRYELDVRALSGPLLVQVRGSSSGEPVILHSLAVAVDVGSRAVNVTPLTELMTAFTLGGTPHELLQDGRVDFMRVNATTLRSNLDRVKNLIRPLLTLASADAVDPRTGAFGSDHSGLAGVGKLLELQRQPNTYALRAVGSDRTGITVDPVSSSTDAVLQALQTSEQDAARAALAALADIDMQLAALQALFAGGIPASSDLMSLFGSDFRHTGLDAPAFVERVLQRRDSNDLGGYSLEGAHFGGARVLQVAAANQLLVRFQVRPRAPWLPYSETLWMQKSGGRWLWQGDGKAGHVKVRHIAVLGARPLAEAQLRSLPGMRCVASAGATDPQCKIEGGQADVPAGGLLDFGAAGSAQFGLFASYRSDAATWQERLAAARLSSKALGTPSARVTRQLAFEVDARRIDPRIQRVRVTGPGLPSEGLDLNAKTAFSHLPLADRTELDAHHVETGRCADAEDRACRDAWAQLRAGSIYSFAFIANDGSVLQTLNASLPSTPLTEERLTAQRETLFTRFDLAAALDQQPQYARVVDPALAGKSFKATWAWRAASAASLTPLSAVSELQLADPMSGDIQWRRKQQAPARLVSADGRSVWDVDMPIPAGWLPVWLTARLTSTDVLGNHFVHYIAPNNPY